MRKSTWVIFILIGIGVISAVYLLSKGVVTIHPAK